MTKTVYLAGPIGGYTHEGANGWRDWMCEKLEWAGLKGISPLRCEPIVGEKYEFSYEDEKFGTARAIGSKNFYDTRECDFVLVYLPKPPDGQHQSYGTLLELGWARAIGKPVIVVSDDPDILKHPVIDFCASWRLDTLEDAIEVLKGVLSDYAKTA